MHSHLCIHLALAALYFLAAGARPARSDGPRKDAPTKATPTPQQIRKAAERGLAFLEKDAVKWRNERKCATCHHGTTTVWALSEAKSQGYTVAVETLADTARWTKSSRTRTRISRASAAIA